MNLNTPIYPTSQSKDEKGSQQSPPLVSCH